jgi:hypothetical protein
MQGEEERTTALPPIGVDIRPCAPATEDAILAALRRGPLAREVGLGTWQHATVSWRLHRGLRAEQRTLDLLVDRYHVPLQDLVDKLVGISVRWHRTRPLPQDSGWPENGAGWTAPRLRRLLPTLHALGDFVRDNHERLAATYDDALQIDMKRGLTRTEAAEGLAREVTLTRLYNDRSSPRSCRRLSSTQTASARDCTPRGTPRWP